MQDLLDNLKDQFEQTQDAVNALQIEVREARTRQDAPGRTRKPAKTAEQVTIIDSDTDAPEYSDNSVIDLITRDSPESMPEVRNLSIARARTENDIDPSISATIKETQGEKGVKRGGGLECWTRRPTGPLLLSKLRL